MPIQGIPLQAHIVLDNSVLSLLGQYWCKKCAPRIPANKRVAGLEQWMAELFQILRQFRPDGCIHSSEAVLSECVPEAWGLSSWPQMEPASKKGLRTHIQGLIQASGIDQSEIRFFRDCPAAPHKSVGPGGVCDNDLSLLVLAVQLAERGDPLYVLSHDHDLLTFVMWARTCRHVKDRYAEAGMVNALHGLTYLENVHRSCKIPTDQMEDMLKFAMCQHYGRKDLAGTLKGESIWQQLMTLQTNLVESVEIKATVKAGLA